jgi:hypothetical protein
MTSAPKEFTFATPKESEATAAEADTLSSTLATHKDEVVAATRESSTSHTPRLPFDVIECIMSLFSADPDVDNNPGEFDRFHIDMLSFCLVCREWTNPGRRSLYRIIPWNHRKHDRLMGTFQTARSLRSLVKLLLVDMGTPDWIHLVRLLPKVEVHVDGILATHNISDFPQILPDLFVISNKLKRLSLEDTVNNNVTSVVIDPNFWGSLEELSLSRFESPIDSMWHMPPKTGIYFPNLTSLTLDNCELIVFPKRFVCKLQKLKLIECKRIYNLEFIDFVLRHSNTLTHTTVENSSFTMSWGSYAEINVETLFATITKLACNLEWLGLEL